MYIMRILKSFLTLDAGEPITGDPKQNDEPLKQRNKGTLINFITCKMTVQTKSLGLKNRICVQY